MEKKNEEREKSATEQLHQNEVDATVGQHTAGPMNATYAIPTKALEPPSCRPHISYHSAHVEHGAETEFWAHVDNGSNMGSLGQSTEELRKRMEAELEMQLQRWEDWSEIGIEGDSVTIEPSKADIEIEEILVNLREY